MTIPFRNRLVLPVLLLFISICTPSLGQNLDVSGTISDQETGEPMPAVTVVVQGSNQGTVSNVDGFYEISVPQGSTLIFSFVGYLSQEIPVEGRVQIDVSLIQEATELEEIVVIGYGTASAKLLTSSISRLSSEDLEGIPSVGIEGTLQGTTAGVLINQNSGTPGAAPTIRVRGISSIFGSSSPLYVVDGIPIITGNFGQIGFEGQDIDATANLDPGNIESISILKDASAAAIYGTRGAKGVVLITTKTGKANQSNIDFRT